MVDGLIINVNKGAVIFSKSEHDIVAAGAWMNDETMSQHHGVLFLSGLNSQNASLFATTGATQRKSHLIPGERSDLTGLSMFAEKRARSEGPCVDTSYMLRRYLAERPRRFSSHVMS